MTKFRPDPKPEPSQKKTPKGIKAITNERRQRLKSLSERDWEVNLHIWKTRHHICEECFYDYLMEYYRGITIDINFPLYYFQDGQKVFPDWKNMLKFKAYLFLKGEPLKWMFDHILEKGRGAFEYLRFEPINVRFKCLAHHNVKSGGKVSRYERIMRQLMLDNFISKGMLPNLTYEHYFKS